MVELFRLLTVTVNRRDPGSGTQQHEEGQRPVAWDFSTEPEFEAKLKWMRSFVADEIAPLELLWPDHHHRVPPPFLQKVINPLKQEVRNQGLWACHLGPDLGGKGYGQVKLALM